jgi:hypothetical protein
VLGATFTRLQAEIVGVLLLIAIACLGVGFWLHEHDARVKATATAPILAAADAASAAQAAKAAKTDADQAANLHEVNAQNAARAVDARDLAGAVAVADRMRDDQLRRIAAAQASRPASAGDTGIGNGADMVPRSMLAAALDARAAAEHDASDLAVYADGLRASGQLCVSDYRSAQ